MLGPPGLGDDTTVPSNDHQNDPRTPDWREMSRPLNIDGHDIWIFMPSQTISDESARYYTPAKFGDREPNPDGPDPDVWPLEKYDPGAPAPVDELIRIGDTYPVPHVAWVTEEYLDALNEPHQVELGYRDLPPWKRPDDMQPGDTITVTPGSELSMTLTKARKKALRRIARLWNGEVVNGWHLLLDKCPEWKEIFAGLDEQELVRLYNDPSVDPEMIEAFRGCEWFEVDATVLLKPQRILRKKVWYAPTLSAKTLINGREDIPSLRGDPREGLRHRVTIGLVALFHLADGHKVSTYEQVGDYVVDLVVHADDGSTTYIEVITDHNNWKLHRATYAKLADLRDEGDEAHVVFDKRHTAYKVFNHWQSAGIAELPTGSFDNDPRLSWAREKIQDAESDPAIDWIVSDWGTTDWFWRHTLGADGPDIDDDIVTSISW